METFFLLTPQEIGQRIAVQARQYRLSLNMTQKTLSTRSDVSLSVIKKFERTGKISLESLLKIALTLNALDTFENLFQSKEQWVSLDNLLKTKSKRKRGRT